MKISVLGAGAWGTALAMAAAARHDVLLWTRDAKQATQMRALRCNPRYLPEVGLPVQLRIDADHAAALQHAQEGLLVIATPMAALRECLSGLPAQQPVLWLCKGFESGSGDLGHEIARALRPGVPAGVLSGPSFALEVAREQPTALVAASTDPALCDAAVQAFHSETLRVYRSADPVGVEVGGAVKNVLAIATGLVDGLADREDLPHRPGLNARAALVTRGLAEMTRLGVALGARAETFMGLSGLGDLVLTATGDLSRNRRVGSLLAKGLPLADILAQLGHVAEGVYSAPTVLARAQRLGVQMPITQAVVEVLDGRLEPVQAMRQLMAREATREG
ncbi:MAG: NAD(P)-dependent glycerol-3-phosphate dehydrogenase [Burkholderiales bacterium]|nr:NAD(P)-dependent glycerol-3-phosphate dehydrogenase [Burkholderiales bacterium]